MAVRLNAWLQHLFEGQLLLGNHWLEESLQKKHSDVNIKTDPDREWQDLYADNGSCLDISNNIYTGSDSVVQIIKLQPLILADSQHHIQARLARDAIRDLRQHPSGSSRLSLQCAVSIRKYTIRYTSYGPLDHRLQIVVHRLDWLGHIKEPARQTLPLYLCEEIALLTVKLDRTRKLADRRCLPSGAWEGEEEDPTMAPKPDESPASQSPRDTQLPHTQLPFVTQVVHPRRPQRRDDELEFLGIRRMEPVLAGNTRRKELTPVTSNTQNSKMGQLLNLLHKPSANSLMKPPIAPSSDRIRPGPNSPSNVSSSTKASPARQATIDVQTPPAARDDAPGMALSPTSSQRAKRNSELQPPEKLKTSGRDGADAEKEFRSADSIAEDALDHGCVWMKGMVFNHAALTVENEQRRVLQKDTSWHHPQPGVLPFPEGNIPIELLTKFRELADSAATSENQISSSTESDMTLLEPAAQQNTHTSELSPQHGGSGASQVSWSPSPEPPQRSPFLPTVLPPDSSFEPQPAEAQTVVEPVSIDDAPEVDPLRNKEDKDIRMPSSSPPDRTGPHDSDDEMEMEASIPRGLGEDVTDPHPTIKVEETPYTKGKANAPMVVSPQQKQTSSGNSKDTSTTSIVFGTYNDSECFATGNATNVTNTHKPQEDRISSAQAFSPELAMEDVQPGHLPAKISGITGNSTVKENTEEHYARSAGSHAEAARRASIIPDAVADVTDLVDIDALGNNLASPGPPKRKLIQSPDKKGRRPSKRREIKLVGFGDRRPVVDPMLAVQRERQDMYRRRHEQRNSSTRSESVTGSPTATSSRPTSRSVDPDYTIAGHEEEFPQAMSPRHESLYEDAPPASLLAREPGLHQPLPRGLVSGLELLDIPSSSTKNRLSTIFEVFKATYPEYTGDTRHFRGQCMEIHKLEQQEKMVPKWQWDDFVIRNRTDYRVYANECLDNGSNPEPYHRYYKDNVRDIVYQKGILTSRTTILQALSELDGMSSMSSVNRFNERMASSRKTSRTSLPSGPVLRQHPSANQYDGVVRARPRQSLPVGSSNRQPRSMSIRISDTHDSSANPSSHTASRHLLSRLPVDDADQGQAVREEAKRTGDPFRDFYFGVQRATSVVGSTKVDKNKPWPQNLALRPSIDDVPKRKINILGWKDTL